MPGSSPSTTTGSGRTTAESHRTTAGSHRTAAGSHRTTAGSHPMTAGSYRVTAGSYPTTPPSSLHQVGRDETSQVVVDLGLDAEPAAEAGNPLMQQHAEALDRGQAAGPRLAQ